MGVKLQKITVYTVLLLITLLFVYLFFAVNRDIEYNKHRERGYLNSLIVNEIKQTQSEIMATFELFLKKSRELQDYSLEEVDLDSVLLQSADLSYIEYVSYVKLGEYISFYPLYSNNFTLNLDIEERIRNRDGLNFQEFVYSDRAHGFFIFPISLNNKKVESLLIISISYKNIIHNHLLPRLKELLEGESYTLKLVSGEDILTSDISTYDSLFDLDEIYTLRDRDDYFKRVRNMKNDFVSEVIIKEQNLYLTISHPLGGIETLYNRKRFLNFLGLIVLYIAIILPLLYIHITHLNLKRSVDREKEFTALISHELKTPLSVIQLGGENLKSGVVFDKDGVQYYGNLITEQAFKLKKMIERILTISTIDQERGDITQQPESCKDMVEEVLGNLTDTINKHNVHIVKEYGLDEEIIIPCHRVSLTACLQNIIDNGIVYGASKSESRELKLGIETNKRGRRDGVRFIVQDYGPGIPSSEWNSIFKSYQRGKTVMSEQLPGTGLGLSISRKIINKMGGSVTLNKSLKKGATFEVWIPGKSI